MDEILRFIISLISGLLKPSNFESKNIAINLAIDIGAKKYVAIMTA